MSRFGAAILAVFLGCPAWADADHPQMEAALELLVQAETLHDPDDVAAAKETALLTEALKGLKAEPDNGAYKGRLVLAIKTAEAALKGLAENKPADQVRKTIGRAVEQLQSAMTRARSDVADLPPVEETPTNAAPAAPVPPPDPGYLKNADFKDGWVYWRGSGEVAYLKPDGTEGTQDDKDVTRVIKMTMSHGQSREVFQEFKTVDHPPHLHIKVDVFASLDFKRSSYANDYTINWTADSQEYFWSIVVPHADFWTRIGPPSNTGFMYTNHNLKPGTWVSFNDGWDLDDDIQDRVVNFCFPPGDGTVYLKNTCAQP